MEGVGDGTRAPKFSTGTYSNGVLYVTKDVIESIHKPKPKVTDDQATALPAFRGGSNRKPSGKRASSKGRGASKSKSRGSSKGKGKKKK